MGTEKLLDKTYTLRYAAGAYWLVDIGQRGADYRPPLQLNRMGADIVRLLSAGEAQEAIVRRLCGEYEARDESERALVRRDVENFLRTLWEKDIEITEEKGTVIL